MHLTHVIELFPTPVMFSYYSQGVSESELAHIRGLEWVRNTGNQRTLDAHILNHPELSLLKAFCIETLQSYVDSVFQPKHELTICLTQSWANKTIKGQFHHQHNHMNSLLSGVLYLSAEQDSITFIQPERKLFSIPPAVTTNQNAEKCVFSPSTNELLVFPSYLFHQVETKQSEGERMSLAFNALVKGMVGAPDALTELIL